MSIQLLQKNNQSRKNTPEYSRGFTIVEMLIAVLIFTLSLAALMTIASRGLRLAHQTQKQVVAEYLALEGIEGVRNIRDAAFLRVDNNQTWQGVFNQSGCLSNQGSGGNIGCALSLSPNISIFPCQTCEVKYSSQNYSYRQGDTSAAYQNSGFTRRIQLLPVTGTNDEMIVRVTVAWDGGEVVYTEDLFLWL